MKRIIALLALICCLAAAIFGCSSPAPESSSEPAESLQGAAPGVYGPLSEKVITAMADGDYSMTVAITTEVGAEGQEPQQLVTEAKTVQQGENYAVQMPDAGMRIVVKDSVSLVVFDNQKIYMDLSLSGLDPDSFEIPDIASVISYMGEGTGTVMGRELPYEEYGAEGGTSRYYFDGESLAFITTSAEGMEIVMEVKEFLETADTALFDIPEDFTQIKSLDELNSLSAA
ncbi:MAG: hypothetical protein LBU86_01980 [Oscillospiraceae bacterium]|jgi:hypothetical protein|nr:hypothetical protein [Oscillospiraceae bacterium]